MARGRHLRRPAAAPLEVHKTIEIGHIFKLGYKYSESMGLRVLNDDGEEVTPIMGSYGIGIERILCAADRAVPRQGRHVLPASIAPFQVVVTPVNIADAAQREAAANDLRRAAARCGLDALLDDRDERPGVKFKDADLIGIPYRITTVGKKLAQGAGGTGQPPNPGIARCARRRGGRGAAAVRYELVRQIRDEFPALGNCTYLNTATLRTGPLRAQAAVAAALRAPRRVREPGLPSLVRRHG